MRMNSRSLSNHSSFQEKKKKKKRALPLVDTDVNKINQEMGSSVAKRLKKEGNGDQSIKLNED